MTSYQPYEAPAAEPWQRQVRYEVNDALLRQAPACAVIAPPAADSGALGRAVEAALGRGLTQRVTRVIQPRARDRMLRELALDLGDARSRRWFAGATGCRAVLDWSLTRDEDAFVVVWAHRAIGVQVALTGPDGAALWRARHDAWRGDGGLPLGPVGALTSAAAAARLNQDPELIDSMADDLARRLFATLPDMR
ncbi:MAG: hypothetical protein RIM84_06190 [Alphaproteobacteria bacterium]